MRERRDTQRQQAQKARDQVLRFLDLVCLWIMGLAVAGLIVVIIVQLTKWAERNGWG